ncbi:heavy metal translocating P-type ATPase [Marinobacter sp. DY40_1A1]|uniref:heavy metal translocating P-type ATPase n=1 Tax=Marinobacter sp. DY40_1A1 TaxID=2583229 RepID=UPI001904C2D4|nr:cation-translocating P-type ATPase [Marinobacter sp. DY40_1A1]MBK1885658.1 cation-translocating P-type ATPase [Marinobacter sp. DY40_1A1]
MEFIKKLSQWRRLWNSPASRRGMVVLVSGVAGVGGVASNFLGGSAGLTSALWLFAAAVAGTEIALRAFAALRARTISIELLVTIAAIGALFIGEYWESAAVTFLFVLGGYLEARTLSRTRSALKDLLALAPTEVTVLRDGEEFTLAPHEVVKGDMVIVRPGGRLGVDGVILSGQAAIDESAITGEPVPAQKQSGDTVFAGTVSHDGYLQVRAEGVGADTTLARIIQRVEEAQEAKAPTQRMIERFASWYTPAIIVMAIGAYLITKDVALALTLLVIACPGALVISTPISVIAGIGRAACGGILIKGGEYLETAGRIRAVAFDKTGTLTEGRPEVLTATPLAGIPALPGMAGEDSPRTRLLQWAALAESGSEHPLGRAVERALPEGYVGPRVDQFETAPGGGISAQWQSQKIEIGSPVWLEERVNEWPEAARIALEEIRERGETVAAVSVDGVLVGLLGFADKLRPEAAAALQHLRDIGVRRLVMLTGDHLASAQRIAREVGIDEVQAGLLPEQKLEAIQAIQRETGATAMVGDGINDAPALATADIGIAMGVAGTDVAIESADIALMADDLGKIGEAIGLARATLNNIRQNVVIALLTVFGLLAGVFANEVHMAGGMFIHQISVLVVVINGMRLMKARPARRQKSAPAVGQEVRLA